MKTVYYADAFNRYIDPPESVLKSAYNSQSVFAEMYKSQTTFLKCPAFTGMYRNTFTINNPYDFRVTAADTGFQIEMPSPPQSPIADQRAEFPRFFSIYTPALFLISDSDSLEFEQVPPLLHNPVPDAAYCTGGFDCAKHFRKLELALVGKKDIVHDFKAGEPLYYIRFKTDEKVQFKRFFYTKKMDALLGAFIDKPFLTKRVLPLSYYYDAVKKMGLKSRVIKEIKENLYG